jgi:beta-fructofuranosidase
VFARLAGVAALSLRAEGRGSLADDPLRPRFHFLPPANWMNDPNGPIYWKGTYHMFYQYNPNAAYSGDKHWGHASSPDMIHWKHLPIALAPTPGGPDKDGVYTGSAVDDNGTPTLVFTGVKPEVQMIATSDDRLIHWTKFAGNPVIPRPPADLHVRGFRDPAPWKEGAAWYMIVGSGIKDEGGMALLYRSADLRHWEYVHPLATGQVRKTSDADAVAQNDMWECPDFFPLGNKHVLIVSTGGKSPYFVGSYADGKFHAETQGHTDFGAGYAAKTMLDASGRRIYWAWLRERRKKEAYTAAGWAGVMSLPHVLTLRADNRLGIEPLPELKSLRGKRKGIRSIDLSPGKDVPIRGVPGDCIEILAEFDPGTAEHVGLKVRAASDGSEYTLVGFNHATETLFTDTRHASLNPDAASAIESGHFSLAPGEPLKLHIYLDASVMEVFANGRACLVERLYPTRADSLGIGAFCSGGKAKLRSLQIWPVRPISPDSLTSVSSA